MADTLNLLRSGGWDPGFISSYFSSIHSTLMKFLSLTLSLIVSNCLAADSSNRSDSSPKPSANAPETASNELENYIDLTTSHFVELWPKLLSIEEASKLSRVELDKLEKESEYWAAEASPGTSYVTANASLAKLIKLGNALPVKMQTTFNAWKDSSFSAALSLDFFTECVDYYSSRHYYCLGSLEHALHWHQHVSSHLDFYGEDSNMSQHHIAQHYAIEFIYCGLKQLKKTDHVVFIRFIREGTLQDIRDLAKKVVSSGHYPDEAVDCFIKRIPDDKFNDANRIILLGNAFRNEIFIALGKRHYVENQNDLQARDIAFNLKFVIDGKDPKSIVKAYEDCITKTKKSICTEALRSMWDVIYHKQKREHLSNKISNSTNSQFTDLLKKVVDPAIILVNCKRILHDTSYEGTVMEKCRDYVEHKDDFEYIRTDSEGIRNRIASLDKTEPYSLVKKIVKELKKDLYDQKCSFDLTSKKLTCKSLKKRGQVKKLLRNEIACRILKEFFDDAISKKSLSTAISNFEAQAKNHWVLIEADEDLIRALNNLPFL